MSGSNQAIIFLLFLGTCLCFCATPRAPEGGPRDRMPPRLVPEESTPNFQTHFEKQRIELTFDEWIQLRNAFKQVVVSPPLQKPPDISLRGRTVRFDFDDEEELRAEATYTINFGDAVKDLNEGNPAVDLRFVFSTGDYIDSLSVGGKVIDAFTDEPLPDVLVMLYDDLSDTVVRRERPFYFAATNKQGVFEINNVRSDTFKLFALTDVNLNYLFDLDTEKIGFLEDDNISVTDTTPGKLGIRLFEEVPVSRMMQEETDQYGLVKLVFNRPPFDVQWDYDDLGQTIYSKTDGDTLNIWYDLEQDSSWNIYLRKDTLVFDTLEIKALPKSDFIASAPLILKKKRSADAVLTIHPLQAVALSFNHPIAGVNAGHIRLLEDSLMVPVEPTLQLDTADRRTLMVSYSWKEGMSYQLELDSGAVVDMYGLTNDSLRQQYLSEQIRNYGDLTIQIDSLNAQVNYILQLTLNDKIAKEIYLSERKSYRQSFKTMRPGSYLVTIIEDRNGNRRWDPGDYDERRQAERLFRKRLEELRANWEVEALVIPVF